MRVHMQRKLAWLVRCVFCSSHEANLGKSLLVPSIILNLSMRFKQSLGTLRTRSIPGLGSFLQYK